MAKVVTGAVRFPVFSMKLPLKPAETDCYDKALHRSGNRPRREKIATSTVLTQEKFSNFEFSLCVIIEIFGVIIRFKDNSQKSGK